MENKWHWIQDSEDNSGCIISPDNKKYFIYDGNTNEYWIDENDSKAHYWEQGIPSDSFKKYAENIIIDMYDKNAFPDREIDDSNINESKIYDVYSISTPLVYSKVIEKLKKENYFTDKENIPTFDELKDKELFFKKNNNGKPFTNIIVVDENSKFYYFEFKENIENQNIDLNYLNSNLNIEIKNEHSELKARSYYNSKNTRENCHILKEAYYKPYEYDNKTHELNSIRFNRTLNDIALFFAKQNIFDNNSIIIPAPQHTGKAEYTLELANLLNTMTRCTVTDILKCKPHDTLYEQKKNGIEPDIEMYLDKNNVYGMRAIERAKEEGKKIYFLDNVMSTGYTFNKAVELLPDLIPAPYSIGNFVEIEYKNGKYKANNLLETLKGENTMEKEKIELTTEILENAKKVMPKGQYNITMMLSNGEEGEFFKKKLKEVSDFVENAPKLYETDGKIEHPLALRYFHPSGFTSLICEYDRENNEAFGFQRIGLDYDNAEFGYMDIDEIKSIDMMEIDYHISKNETIESWLYKDNPERYSDYEHLAKYNSDFDRYIKMTAEYIKKYCEEEEGKYKPSEKDEEILNNQLDKCSYEEIYKKLTQPSFKEYLEKVVGDYFNDERSINILKDCVKENSEDKLRELRKDLSVEYIEKIEQKCFLENSNKTLKESIPESNNENIEKIINNNLDVSQKEKIINESDIAAQNIAKQNQNENTNNNNKSSSRK